MNDQPNANDASQAAVNAMAVAIAKAEMETEGLMILLGKLPQALRDFRKGCNLHAMLTAEAAEKIGGAIAMAGGCYAALYEAHEELAELLKKCDLPQPGPVPQGGGGGGKANGGYDANGIQPQQA